MSERILEVNNLKVHFPIKRKKGQFVRAVDDVSFTLDKGEILSLVGESGSGKTTTGKAILQLIKETTGEVIFEGKKYDSKCSKEELKAFRQKAQMVYQDPYQSLNPRQYIIDIVAEPLDVNNRVSSAAEREENVQEALERAGLQPARDYFFRYPYELSGGQRQRVALASSLILNPDFIVADEPVSMIDASVRLGIVKFLKQLQTERNIAFLFITHDLSLAWLISDRIAILYLGKIMEIGTANQIVKNCKHPYALALMDVMPIPGMTREEGRHILGGDIPSAAEEIPGCKFFGRCPHAMDICKTAIPDGKEVEPGHIVYCHMNF